MAISAFTLHIFPCMNDTEPAETTVERCYQLIIFSLFAETQSNFNYTYRVQNKVLVSKYLGFCYQTVLKELHSLKK